MHRAPLLRSFLPALMVGALAPAPLLAAPEDAPKTGSAPGPAPVEAPRWKEAPDSLGGSWAVAPSGTWVVPFGRPDTRVSQRAVSGNGWRGGLELAYGLTRTVAVGLSGDYSWMFAGNDCFGCRTAEVSVGPRLRYHLVQGTKLDPWVDFGVAYRRSEVDAGATRLTWEGMDVARLRVGGEWYPLPNLGIGPVLGLDNTVFWTRPEEVTMVGGTSGGGHAAWRLTYEMGLRAVLRFPGRF